MFKFLSNKSIVNIVIDDYVIRMVNHAEGSIRNIKGLQEKVIPSGLIEHGRILDEIEFFQFMKDTIREWNLKRRFVQFYVPDSLVIMKKVSYPAHLTRNQAIDHLNLEVGQTLYLPFDNPIIDIFPLPENKDKEVQEALLFAVPEEEIKKYTDILEDCGLKPLKADIRSIGIYRYFHYMQPQLMNESILFLEMNLNSIMISIFSNGIPEFMRLMILEIDMNNWQYTEKDINQHLHWNYTGDENELVQLLKDQVMELERILNFYQYSIHKGEKGVSKIVLLGDFPYLERLNSYIQGQIPISTELFDAYLSPRKSLQIARSFIPAIGLALKGGAK